MIDHKKFSEIRKKAKLSQSELAKAAGVSQQLIGEIERGRSKTTKAIYKLAAAMYVSAHTLDPDIPTLDDELQEIMVQITQLPPDQAKLVRRTLKDTLKIAQGGGRGSVNDN